MPARLIGVTTLRILYNWQAVSSVQPWFDHQEDGSVKFKRLYKIP